MIFLGREVFKRSNITSSNLRAYNIDIDKPEDLSCTNPGWLKSHENVSAAGCKKRSRH